MNSKIYVGTGKVRESQYGEFYTVGLKLSELEKYVNEKGYVNIVISKRKNEDKYGNNLSVAINEYTGNKTNTKKEEDISIEDLPF